MSNAANAMAEILEKQVPMLEVEGFFETAAEATETVRLLRLLAELEIH